MVNSRADLVDIIRNHIHECKQTIVHKRQSYFTMSVGQGWPGLLQCPLPRKGIWPPNGMISKGCKHGNEESHHLINT